MDHLLSFPSILSFLPLLFHISVHSLPLPTQLYQTAGKQHSSGIEDNIILNPRFEDGLSNWSGKGCKIELHESMGDGQIVPQSGKFFASATERTEKWNGIQQEITGRVHQYVAYEVTALVRIYSGNVTSAGVQLTLWLQEHDFREEYIIIANLQATETNWLELQGEFLLNSSPSRAILFLEGPSPGTDILLNTLFVKHPDRLPHPIRRPVPKNAPFGVNIIENTDLDEGTTGWFPLGTCSLSVQSGSPHVVPPMARDSLGLYTSLSGRYVLVTNRSESWTGPAQMITEKLKLYFTYQVSAWVRIGAGATGPQMLNVAIGMDSQWVNGGQIESNDDKWHEIGGSFRIEKQPSNAMVYVQGPASGVDFMVAGLHIFPVNRKARFSYLKKQTDKIRKRDIILKFSGAGSSNVLGSSVKVAQTKNSFPLGSCITRTSIDNEEFTKFFIENFNWAVFENEMKWSWTEPQQGKVNYKQADELVDWCKSHNMEIRGHCIFWDMEYAIQSWVRSLNGNELMSAVQNRLTDLLTRYKGTFRHYDVNNEMLHGSFYQDRLGKDIRANMFKTANQLDPSATLFVNDYHIEDGIDLRSTPDKYIQQITNLQEQGAPVGGIGIQGHIDVPVGPIVASALDKLGTLGLPIWFTELDVSSANEYVRAEDLEVMLREAYAHPAVEGVNLWGFWELYMSRKYAHLVNADGKINAAGKRFLSLKKEWLSEADGNINDQGEFRFRGFHGTYNLEIVSTTKNISKTFVIEKGDSPLIVSIDL
ncbi:glycosyl hydrolase family 10 protein / carbohydrate-binding domain-containing protein [Euphorbia peplus]|nr:glycosyl hydrolase family 10 protein / carbohydrate-binding domain-containing protein [Euphorbia peplus]